MVDYYDLQKDLSESVFKSVHCQHERFSQSLNDDEALPATRSELIVIALLDMGRPASAEDINLWITRLLGADYRDHRWPGCHENPAECLITIGDLLHHAFDLPVIEVSPETRVDNVLAHNVSAVDSALLTLESWLIPRSIADSMLPRPTRWTVPIRDAALFLRRSLFSPWSPDKHFPIMKLPVELREYIFTYALALPPGACMRTKEPCKDCRSDLCERWEISAPRWNCASTKQYEVDADFLALLRVSKAFHREAAPCFWSQDIRVSGNAPKICRLLRGAMGWKYVRKIDLKLRDDGDQRALDDDEEIALLASMPRLRSLTVRLTPLRPYRSKEGIFKVPGVASLRRHVRGLEELVVRGPLEKCEDVFRAELMGPRKVSGVS